MLGKNGLNDVLKRVMACCELTDECQNDIQCVIDNYDECLTSLTQCGTITEGDDGNCSFTANEVTPVDDGYKEKYEKLHQQYIDRFFGGNGEEKPEEKPEETPEEKDENITIDDLFK